MSRTLPTSKESSRSKNQSVTSKYKLFIWDVGTDSRQPCERNIRTIAAIEYSSSSTHLEHFSAAVRPSGVNTKKPTPTFPEVWKSFRSYVTKNSDGKPPLLVSHNAAFDVTVLLTELHRADLKLPKNWRFACSLLFSRSVSHFNTDNSQIAIANRLGISIERQHHTPEDVLVLRRILVALDDKAFKDDKPLDRVVPALSLHARKPEYFDRTPQIDPESTASAKIFITYTGTKYHRDGCTKLSRSKIPRVTPPPGMKPCGVCRPDDETYNISDKPSTKNQDNVKGSKKPSRSRPTHFFVTATGKKYHQEGCEWLKKSKIQIDFPPEGFAPCKTCLKDFRPPKHPQKQSKSKSVIPDTNKTHSKGALFYVTNTGKKYHRKDCVKLSDSCIPKSETPSGYGPCGICLPSRAYVGAPLLKKVPKEIVV